MKAKEQNKKNNKKAQSTRGIAGESKASDFSTKQQYRQWCLATESEVTRSDPPGGGTVWGNYYGGQQHQQQRESVEWKICSYWKIVTRPVLTTCYAPPCMT